MKTSRDVFSAGGVRRMKMERQTVRVSQGLDVKIEREAGEKRLSPRPIFDYFSHIGDE